MVSTRLILTTLWLFLVCPVSWSCLPCDLVTCEPLHLWQCDDYRQRILDPKCGCCPVCPKKELERCGGETNDQCETGLICRYRSGNILGIHKTGMCEPDLCSRIQCPYRQRCRTQRNETTQALTVGCSCPQYFRTGLGHRKVCSFKENPLCGNDGVNYRSHCHLQWAECTIKKGFIGINHEGRCERKRKVTVVSHDPVTTPPATFNQSIENNTLSESSAQNDSLHTDNDMAPSCTYNGRVYSPFTIIPIPNDICNYLVCNSHGVLYNAPVPGCGENAPEPDYRVQYYPFRGKWKQWSEWTPCEGGCYNGTQSRYRNCTNRAEGYMCAGAAKETRECFHDYCNITCDYTWWSPWSPCSVSCGDGVSFRTREIKNNQAENITLKACTLLETKPCRYVRTCPITTVTRSRCSKLTAVSRSTSDLRYPLWPSVRVWEKGEESHCRSKKELISTLFLRGDGGDITS
ncbi:spondin-1-like isoform X2 [Halichondria panicea]|uniref:spondin-1-like isoform X2 n=1 Tax=Halichondria panicea TaxID=6063 RepID=UPI00312B5813